MQSKPIHQAFASNKSEAAKQFRRSNQNEIKICGLNACLAVAKLRINDIIRVYVTEDRLKAISHILHWCAEHKKAYHVVTSAELEKITETHHNEGICILAKQKTFLDLTKLIQQEKEETKPRAIIFLEDISNPHNLGAIIRVSAHFAAASVLVYNTDKTANHLSSAVYRTSEGGIEFQEILFVDDPIRTLKAFKKIGFTVFATSSHASDSLYSRPLPPKCIFIFGSESNGISPLCLKEADRRIIIPGSGSVESLNVACATSTTLGEFFRTYF